MYSKHDRCLNFVIWCQLYISGLVSYSMNKHSVKINNAFYLEVFSAKNFDYRNILCLNFKEINKDNFYSGIIQYATETGTQIIGCGKF